MRKVFLDDLPRWEGGANKGNINWKQSVSHKVKFNYDDIEGEVEIVNYDGKNLHIEYKEKKNFRINPSSFLKCNLGALLGKKTRDFKIKIGQIFKDNNRDMIVLYREYRNNAKWYKYKCNICGWNEGWIEESHLVERKQGCSCCRGLTAVLGINTIWDTDRWMCELGVSEEDAKKYTAKSGEKIYVICSHCKNLKKDKIMINKIYRNHSIGCKYCSDGISYSEKVVSAILKQLNLKFINQLNKLDLNWCKDYRYDFYIPEFNCIIETHGMQHYEKVGGYYKSLEEQQENDRLKEKLAKENGIENYIVIDCRYSQLKWIKKNIFNSKLIELLYLNNIDWLRVQEFTFNNQVKEVCEVKVNNPSLTTTEISNLMNLGVSTVRRYFQRGSELNWIKYNPKEEQIRVARLNGKSGCKKVEIFKDKTSLGVFESVVQLSKISEFIFNVKLDRSGISQFCLGKYPCKTYKGYTFKYVD